MAQFNPYAAPASESDPAPRRALDDEGFVTSEVIEVLQQTRPWVQMLGVLGYLGIGFIVLCGLAILGLSSALRWGIPAWVGVPYLGLAVLYVFPCRGLVRYGRAIGDLQRGEGVPALVEALRQQKAVWRYIGITSILVMVIFFTGLSMVGNVINFMNISRL